MPLSIRPYSRFSVEYSRITVDHETKHSRTRRAREIHESISLEEVIHL